MPKEPRDFYIVFDGRDRDDQSEALALDTADTLPEAIEAAKGFGDALVVRYKANGGVLVDGEMVFATCQ